MLKTTILRLQPFPSWPSVRPLLTPAVAAEAADTTVVAAAVMAEAAAITVTNTSGTTALSG
ncbi:MAG TPA: hypothetical protein VMW57_00760 [Methyloceanibacter sp.]|nr:hypothetical protein [Methyloceanibacter sp.]